MSKTASSIKALQETPRLIIELFAVFCFVLIAIISHDGQNNFSNIIVKLGIFAAAAFRILPSLNRVVVSINSIKQSQSVINTIYNDFQLENLIVEYDKLNLENEKINKIEIKNLCFKYPKSKKYILEDLNLNIVEGDYVGIYGKSGSGKSTFVNLFSGLLTPDSGEIYFNNKNIKSNSYLWKSTIGYVPQSIYLNHETLKENIAFGEKYEDINNQKILNAINLAQLDDLVKIIPNGIDGIIGENGINLSGGQIQRIGIARALYKNPQILIFDESTNSLDLTTEIEFMNIVNSLREKNIIFISHQLRVLEKCNKLFKFENGKLIKKINMQKFFLLKLTSLFYYLLLKIKLFWSFSQEGEDLIIDRIFKTKKIQYNEIFYLDIGSGHPIKYSNTFYFYIRGSRGICVDAFDKNIKLHRLLRPRDKSFDLILGDDEKLIDYYVFNQSELNTTSKKRVNELKEHNFSSLYTQKKNQLMTNDFFSKKLRKISKE